LHANAVEILRRDRRGLKRALEVQRVATALLLFSMAARAEEIRIEVSRGRPVAHLAAPGGRVEQNGSALELPARTHELVAGEGQLRVDGRAIEGSAPVVFHAGAAPVRLDGKMLSGRIEAWADANGLVLVNALDLEEYVAAVVASEVPSGWPDAALQAQAVAARTFAVAQKIAQGPAARAHLGSSVLDQVYAGSAHPASSALRAARATAGEVLTFGSAPIAAYFSASCGGRSETAEDAFNVPAGTTPYLLSRRDDADEGRAWTVRKSLADVSLALRKAGRVLAPITGIDVSSRTASGRARTVRLETDAGDRTLTAAELRQILGYTALPSLAFDVSVERKTAVFRGRGNGHGVGLCQWGARARALRGETYRAILAWYYPGADIRKMY
jgi:stage II sporulation protein D